MSSKVAKIQIEDAFGNVMRSYAPESEDVGDASVEADSELSRTAGSTIARLLNADGEEIDYINA